MRSRAIKFLKKTLIMVLCTLTLLSALYEAIPRARADSSGILGTNEALGSPILNPNFTVNNWNKWEMVCWGVFLSNFCKPLIDTYETAFKEGAGGSNGAGYKALCFGSGSDNANKDVIESFCDYAILQQKAAGKKQIYVTHRTLHMDGPNYTLEEADNADPNVNQDLARPAYFNDFFFDEKRAGSVNFDDDTNFTVSNGLNTFDVHTITDSSGTRCYADITHPDYASIPIFWIKDKDGKYTKILDYNDSWDIQMVTAMVNSLRTEDESKFDKAFGEFYIDNFDPDSVSSSNKVTMDVFGNILVNDVMLLPAAVNQNITKEKKINLLNAYVFNSYNSTYSKRKLLEGVGQSKHLFEGIYGGSPAFTESKIGNVGLLYYDSDSIVVKDYVKSNDALDTGALLQDMFRQSIFSKSNESPLKFEVTGGDFSIFTTFTKLSPIQNTIVLASVLSNRPAGSTDNKYGDSLSYLITPDGEKVDLFSKQPVLIMTQLSKDELLWSKTDEKELLALRVYMDWVYQVYLGNVKETAVGSITKSELDGVFSSSTRSEMIAALNSLWQKFVSSYPEYKDLKAENVTSKLDVNTRMCTAYPISDVLKAVSSVLGCMDGSEFNTYSTMIYMTYLDFYGVSNKTTFVSGTEGLSEFNPVIYDESSDILNVDPSEIADVKSEDEMEEEVLQMSYLMLEPEKGRQYRKELMYNGISDFIYEQYNRTVFGGAYDKYSGSASKSNSGFLAVETYAENVFTAWFLNAYADIAIILIAVFCVILVVVGLLKGKKISWYFLGLFVIINTLLLVPSSGEIVPYVTSNYVQNMFASKMTAWSIAEGISNATLEAEAASKTGNFEQMNQQDSNTAIKLIKQLNVVYIDRSLMLKQDISQKLTPKLGGVYTQIQQLASARWVLPMVMQQFTNKDDEQGSAYVKLGNVWDDASNLYWYFRPIDASTVTKKTTTSAQFEGSVVGQSNNGGGGAGGAVVADTAIEGYSNIKSCYQDFSEPTWADDDSTTMNYANFGYTIKENENMPHLYSWILPDPSRMVLSRKTYLGDKAEEYKNANSWEDYFRSIVDSGRLTKDNWRTDNEDNPANNHVKSGFEYISGEYDRTQADTMKAGYSFYKTTESPLYYFFNVVKDSFDNDSTSLGSLIGELQGTIQVTPDNQEVRSNFMYATKTSSKEEYDFINGVTNSDLEYTPYIRDCLDLQYLFHNVVPYLYQMTLQTGGFDGKSGVLEDLEITENSDFYKGNKQSWAYRCNWAVKLMENPEYSKPLVVRDADGNKYTVNNPMLHECYPDNRPMVFSEAQQVALGLKDSDLNLVELKCVEINKRVAKRWTLLLNYAGAGGLTKEVIFRQMATDATTIFCEEFSSGGVLNTIYGLYPRSIDLRYLSFDSVMKMLMLNVSKDTSYIYGDTMSTLIENSDMTSAILLLLTAWACSYIVPFTRIALMALIFYLGFIAIIRTVFSTAEYKTKVACGQLISNLIFMAYTLVYYACFAALMSITSADEVLSVNKIQANAGNPVWVLLIVLIISVAYFFVMATQIIFCCRHYVDMGSEVYSQVAGAITSRVGKSIHKLGDRIKDLATLEGNGKGKDKGKVNNKAVSGESAKGNGTKGKATSNGAQAIIEMSNGNKVLVREADNGNDSALKDGNAGYKTNDKPVDKTKTSSEDINAQIDKGKNNGNSDKSNDKK